MSKLYDELRNLIRALDREHIEYALCGGIAVAIHGHPRATVDIDMLIQSESLPEVLRIAQQLGYAIRGLDMSFAKDVMEIRRVSKIDPVTKYVLTLDMILVSETLRGIWENRITVDWEGAKLSVVSRDGLIALKQMSGRPQDLADISALEDIDAPS